MGPGSKQNHTCKFRPGQFKNGQTRRQASKRISSFFCKGGWSQWFSGKKVWLLAWELTVFPPWSSSISFRDWWAISSGYVSPARLLCDLWVWFMNKYGSHYFLVASVVVSSQNSVIGFNYLSLSVETRLCSRIWRTGPSYCRWCLSLLPLHVQTSSVKIQ